jgi:predicted amidohydrolase
LWDLYGDLARAAQEAESLDGPTVSALCMLAIEHQLWLVGGSIAERTNNGKAFNTSLTINPTGDVVGIYRKMHLFDVDLGATLRVQESDHLAPGESVAGISTDSAELGVAICYDLRFPELFRQLSAQGTEILCVPAAFTYTTGQDHWELLVRARAVENQCYLIAANQVGQHSPASRSFGNSLIVDPWGRVLAKASGEHDEVIVADLSGKLLSETRARVPALRHRRLP